MKKRNILNYCCIAGIVAVAGTAIGMTDVQASETVIKPVEINATNFPDENFRKCVSYHIDQNADGVLSVEEIESVTDIGIGLSSISSIEGVNYFVNLTYLNCSDINISNLDVSGCTSFSSIDCSYNQLSEIKLDGVKSLYQLNCRGNKNKSVDTTGINVWGNVYIEGDNVIKEIDYQFFDVEYMNRSTFNKQDMVGMTIKVVIDTGTEYYHRYNGGDLSTDFLNTKLVITVPDIVTTDNKTVVITCGDVSTSFDLIVIDPQLRKADDGQWYCYINDAIDTTYTGLADNQYGTWYVNNGKLDTTYTGMYKSAMGWVYLNKGKLDTKYTGLATNTYGTWYMVYEKRQTGYYI